MSVCKVPMQVAMSPPATNEGATGGQHTLCDLHGTLSKRAGGPAAHFPICTSNGTITPASCVGAAAGTSPRKSSSESVPESASAASTTAVAGAAGRPKKSTSESESDMVPVGRPAGKTNTGGRAENASEQTR